MSKSVEITGLTNGQEYGVRVFPRNLDKMYQTRNDRGTGLVTPMSSTTLLLKAVDGAIIDTSDYGYTVTNVGATVEEQGFTVTNTAGYLSVSADCFNNEGDWTIEVLEHVNGALSNTNTALFSTVVNSAYGVRFAYGEAPLMRWSSDGANWDMLDMVACKERVLDEDVYWTFQRSGNNYTAFKNGVIWDTQAFTNYIHKPTANIFYVCFHDGVAGYNATIKEFKMSNIALYTGAYTPSADDFVI